MLLHSTRPINMTQLVQAASHIGIAIAIPQIFSLSIYRPTIAGPS